MVLTRKRSAILGVVVALALAVAGIQVVAQGTAEAYWRHGCEYDNDSISPISYRYYSLWSSTKTAFTDGQARWDQSASPGYFAEQWWSTDPEINVTDGVYGGGYIALASWRCDDDGTYEGNETSIKFDTTEMSNLTTAQKRDIAIHELGHSYGLWDVTGSLCRVMYDAKALSGCAWFPASDDIAGVNAVY